MKKRHFIYTNTNGNKHLFHLESMKEANKFVKKHQNYNYLGLMTEDEAKNITNY